jgi:uncharacterized membrane protein YcfT
LWFIYLLPIFFVVAKATRRLPSWAIWTVAAALEMARIMGRVSTDWTVIDEFAARFVYFYSGYLFAQNVFALSDAARAHPRLALGGLAIWALINATVVYLGYSEMPVVSLALGISGASAVIVIGTLLAKMHWLDSLRYCGEHSIVIYLAFFLPMAASRTLLLKISPDQHIGAISLTVTIVGVIGAVMIWWGARAAGANFLFERPDAFRIASGKRSNALQAAE